jgi:predicted DNA-binding protein with PD1-like motif
MQYIKADATYVIRIEKDEEVFPTLIAFCEAHAISNAHFSGIGAAKEISCGYYALEEKKYYFTSYMDIVEVVSLTGNVALKEGKPFIHMHGLFTDRENKAFGGHIEKMTSGIVLEVVLEPLSSAVERVLDEETGLFLLNCRN